jgi:glycosyltransferase involved in cell wall biosynthesis
MTADQAAPAATRRHGAEQRRVMMIAPTSFFGDYGCHVRILEEIRTLQARGYRVALVTYHMGRNLPEVDIRRTMAIPLRQQYEVGSSRHKIAFDLLLFGRAALTLLQFRPHLIHAHLHEGALIGWVLAKLSHKPLVFDFQGSLTGEMVDHGFIKPAGIFFRPMWRLEKLIDHLAPRILTSSERARAVLLEEFGCQPERVAAVPDGVNTRVFCPAKRDAAWQAWRRAYGVPAGRIVVVYLGLLATYQGIDHLLQAAQIICAQRSDVHFLLGGYPNIEHYHDMARRMGLSEQVTLAGKIPYEQAHRFMGLGDIAVSPKLSRTEGAGKLLDYMALGLPTVTFDTQVSHEYLDDWGVYAQVADSADLARCLLALADDPERRSALGAALRQRAQERFSWDASAAVIERTYDSLLGR